MNPLLIKAWSLDEDTSLLRFPASEAFFRVEPFPFCKPASLKASELLAFSQTSSLQRNNYWADAVRQLQCGAKRPFLWLISRSNTDDIYQLYLFLFSKIGPAKARPTGPAPTPLTTPKLLFSSMQDSDAREKANQHTHTCIT